MDNKSARLLKPAAAAVAVVVVLYLVMRPRMEAPGSMGAGAGTGTGVTNYVSVQQQQQQPLQVPAAMGNPVAVRPQASGAAASPGGGVPINPGLLPPSAGLSAQAASDAASTPEALRGQMVLSSSPGAEEACKRLVTAENQKRSTCTADYWLGYFEQHPAPTLSDADWRRYYDDKGYFCVLPNHPTQSPHGMLTSTIIQANMEFWLGPEATGNGRDTMTNRRPIYQAFVDRIAAGLKEVQQIDFNIRTSLAGKVVGEVAGGPYGGVLEALDVPVATRVQIDPFINPLVSLRYRPWKNTCFVACPGEHIPLPDNSLDTVIGFNSIDHGWRWDHALRELVRIGREVYVNFDVRGGLMPPFHMQVITWDMVEQVFTAIRQDPRIIYAYYKRTTRGGIPMAETFIKRRD